MISPRQLWRRLSAAAQREAIHSEIAQELQFHLDLKTEELIGRGLSRAEAERTARSLFGSVLRVQEEGHDVRGGGAFDRFFRDLRYALRILRKRPGKTFALVATLALGIGVNTAVFSILRSVLFRPLPFASASELVILHQSNKGQSGGVSYPNFLDWRAQSHAFSGMAVYTSTSATLTTNGNAARIHGAIVSANLFELLGMRPVLGRRFLPVEDRLGGGEGGTRPVLISDRFWRARFAGRPQALGSKLVLDGLEFRIVGVIPAWQSFPIESESPPEYWTTVAADAEPSLFAGTIPTSRGYPRYDGAIARLRTGISLSQASAQMAVVASRIERAHPGSGSLDEIRLAPALDDLVGDIRPMLLLLYGAVSCVLLLAVANAAGLLLVDAGARVREFSLRRALGADNSSVAAQLLVESLVLAVLGGVAGMALAWVFLKIFLAAAPASTPRLDLVSLGMPACLYALGVAAVIAPLFGLAPVFLTWRADLVPALKERGSNWRHKRSRVRPETLMISAQIALCTLLTCCASLLIGSFVKILHGPRGFDPEHVLTAQISLPPAGYPQRSAKVAAFYSNLLSRIRFVPGVSAASAAEVLPLSGESNSTSVRVRGGSEPGLPVADLRFVEPGYFSVLRIPLLQGRGFSEHDRLGSMPCALVNQAFVRRFLGNRDPLTAWLALGWGGSAAKAVVGVVGDIRHNAASTQVVPEVYVPEAQFPVNDMTLLLRSDRDPAELAALLRKSVAAMDAAVPVDRIRTLSEYRLLSAAPQRFVMFVLAFFAGTSLALAAIGLYGTLSYAAARREREFGIRLALGSRSGALMALVFRHAGTLTAAGLLTGLALNVFASHLLRRWLYDTDPNDSGSILWAVAVLCGTAFLAAWKPAQRAAEVDPLEFLRSE